MSTIKNDLPILSFNYELKGIMVNKDLIYRQIRDFLEIFWNLIKSDDELVIKIRENGRFRKITQTRICGIKNHSI